MTPRETWQFIDAYQERFDIERRLLMWQTWHIAAFVRAKRLPAYHEIMPRQHKPLSKEEKERKKKEFNELVGKIDKKWQKQQH